MTPEERDRLLALESLVAAIRPSADLVREHLANIPVPSASGVYAILPDASALALLAGRAKVVATGEFGVDLAVNAERRGAFWWQVDATKASYLLRLTPAGGLAVSTVAAAAGQIDWATATPALGTAVVSPILNTGTSLVPVVGIQAATAAQNGYLTAAQFALVAQLATATAWTAATGLYAASWSGFATAGFADAKYRKTVEGQVQLLGLAKKATALALPDTIFTLPAGFRPATTRIFVTASALGTYTEIRVNTGGAVFIQVGGSAGFTALDGVSFDPAQ